MELCMPSRQLQLRGRRQPRQAPSARTETYCFEVRQGLLLASPGAGSCGCRDVPQLLLSTGAALSRCGTCRDGCGDALVAAAGWVRGLDATLAAAVAAAAAAAMAAAFGEGPGAASPARGALVIALREKEVEGARLTPAATAAASLSRFTSLRIRTRPSSCSPSEEVKLRSECAKGTCLHSHLLVLDLYPPELRQHLAVLLARHPERRILRRGRPLATIHPRTSTNMRE